MTQNLIPLMNSLVSAFEVNQNRWRDAICAEISLDLWFSDSEVEQEEAKALCFKCPMQMECLRESLIKFYPYDVHGIWGGLDKQDRKNKKLVNSILAGQGSLMCEL